MQGSPLRCPTLTELPPPPPGKTGWPWTQESPQLPGTMPDGSPWPRVSIVTPSYNQGQFIEETIRSVLLQGYPNMEYIIMDGGSNDSSVDVIHKYEPWLAYWVSEPDKGQADAINRGWRMATGNVIAYLNSDDTYCPEAIRTVVEHFLQYPDVGMVYGDSLIIDDKGVVLREHRLPDMSFDVVLRWLTPISQPAVFLRRETIAAMGMTNSDLEYAMDFDLWLRVGVEFKMKHISHLLANARSHPKAKTRADPMKSFDETILVVEGFFSRNLPAELSALKSGALGARYLNKAYFYYAAGEMASARAWTKKAFRLNPPAFLIWWGVVIFLKSLLGSRLTTWLRQAKHREFRDGLIKPGKLRENENS